MEALNLEREEDVRSSEGIPVQRSVQKSTAEATKSQNAEALAMFVQEMQKCLGHTVTRATESSDSSIVGKGSIGYDKPIREVAGIACRFVQQEGTINESHMNLSGGCL